MKNILISLVLGAALVFGYYFFLGILYQIHPISFDTLTTLLLPLNLPYNVYKSIFGLYHGNPFIVKVLNFAADVLLYSIPFYLILNYFTKRKPYNSQGIENPPEPPIFESSQTEKSS